MTKNSFEEILQKVVLGLLTHHNLEQLLEAIILSAGQIVHTTHGYIDMVDEEAGQLNTRVSMGLFKDIPRVPVQKGHGLSGKVWESGEIQIIRNYDAWEGRLKTFNLGLIRAATGIPIKSEERVIGLLVLAHGYDSKRTFTKKEIKELNSFAGLAALVIQNMRLYESAIRSAERRSILYRATQALSSSLDVEQVYEAIYKAAKQVMPCEDFIIDLYDEARNEMVSAYLIVPPGEKITAPPYYADHGLGGHIVHTGQSVRLNSPEQIKNSGIRFEVYGDGMITSSVIGVPLRSKGKIIGIISTQSYQSWAYTPEDQELLEMLAAHAAIALENAHLFTEVQRFAALDPLTELFNRRRFFELAENEFQRALRYKHPLSVLMIDVDHFKNVNDEHGHQIGDLALSGFAKRCKETLRASDIMGRLGGEEFAIILPETDLEHAMMAAERLSQLIRETQILFEQNNIVQITISVGVASLDHAIGSLDLLLKHADTALYSAKEAGRNCVCMWDQ